MESICCLSQITQWEVAEPALNPGSLVLDPTPHTTAFKALIPDRIAISHMEVMVSSFHNLAVFRFLSLQIGCI